jgi:demethylmenaquinone methyltransferase / 2-methoxy-6-polyprenyl-1,4-benzoquinol methylase
MNINNHNDQAAPSTIALTTENHTHFGFTQVHTAEKEQKVKAVFSSVAPSYDVMNDLMSGGLHRLWKKNTIGHASVKAGDYVLDIASGTGDLAEAFYHQANSKYKCGEVWMTDINADMLQQGKERLLNKGIILPTCVCNAENLPFKQNYFDVVSLSFGLRNMTHKDKALQEIFRVLKPGGKLVVLEFSKVQNNAIIEKLYDWYSFNILPLMGKYIAKDADSYRYLAESIRMHPDQETLKKMMLDAGFNNVKYHNMTAGIVALHIAYKY